VPDRRYSQWSFSPDSNRLALLTANYGGKGKVGTPWEDTLGTKNLDAVPQDTVALRLIDPKTGATLRRIDGKFWPHRFAWSADSKRMVAAGMLPSGRAPTHELACFDTAVGKQHWTVSNEVQDRRVRDLSFSPDGKHVASMWRTMIAGDTPAEPLWVQILDADSGRKTVDFKMPRKRTTLSGDLPPLAWAPSGGRLFAAGQVFEAATGKLAFDLNNIRTIGAWDPTGKVLAAWVDQSDFRQPVIRLYLAQDGKLLGQIPLEGKK
jgi:hypothetical protein